MRYGSQKELSFFQRIKKENVVMNEKLEMGWIPDYPDHRDYTIDHESIKPMIERIGIIELLKVNISTSEDLRPWCSPIQNQFSFGSCTANAGVGLIEYYQKRAFGKHIDSSRDFLYKAMNNFLKWSGDAGSFLRSTMGAMALFGVSSEEWPCIFSGFDKEPSAFYYAFAQNQQTIKYFRLDPSATKKDVLLKRIKSFLACGLPSMFGFTVFNSIGQARMDGKIPYPCSEEKILGGHAVIAVGYDDRMKIINNICGSETTGALLIRNSWGTGWGDGGYGWLPYEYVLKGLAIDWWTLLKNDWIDTGQFRF